MHDTNIKPLRVLPKATSHTGDHRDGHDGNGSKTPPLFKPFYERLAGLSDDYDKGLLSLSVIENFIQSQTQKRRGE